MLEIMKDSRVGAMGVVWAVMLLLVKACALIDLLSLKALPLLIVPPLIARFNLLIAIRFYPYVRKNGIGAGLANGVTRRAIACGFLFALIITGLATGWHGLVAACCAFLAGVYYTRMIVRRLGGLTGDGYGAIVEWTETCCLIFLLISRKWLL
jgi:adenosylcobinamide-GDP ribazoletransferase